MPNLTPDEAAVLRAMTSEWQDCREVRARMTGYRSRNRWFYNCLVGLKVDGLVECDNRMYGYRLTERGRQVAEGRRRDEH